MKIMQNHSRRVLLGLLAASMASPAFAQQPLLDSLTQADARSGVRDAMGLAALNATTRLAQPDAFWSNSRVRIPLHSDGLPT
jgi:hypothetical protein